GKMQPTFLVPRLGQAQIRRRYGPPLRRQQDTRRHLGPAVAAILKDRSRCPPMIQRDAPRDAPVMLPSCWGSARDAPSVTGDTGASRWDCCGLVAEPPQSPREVSPVLSN